MQIKQVCVFDTKLTVRFVNVIKIANVTIVDSLTILQNSNRSRVNIASEMLKSQLKSEIRMLVTDHQFLRSSKEYSVINEVQINNRCLVKPRVIEL